MSEEQPMTMTPMVSQRTSPTTGRTSPYPTPKIVIVTMYTASDRLQPIST